VASRIGSTKIGLPRASPKPNRGEGTSGRWLTGLSWRWLRASGRRQGRVWVASSGWWRSDVGAVLTFGFWPYPRHQVIVLSRTLTTDDSRVTVATSTDEALTLLAERALTAVYVDGGRVIADWLRRGLIDDIVLTRAPVLLGGGIPLFGPLDSEVHLIHVATTFNDGGMTSSHYRVAVPTDLG